jgi:hypothetical protein
MAQTNIIDEETSLFSFAFSFSFSFSKKQTKRWPHHKSNHNSKQTKRKEDYIKGPFDF